MLCQGHSSSGDTAQVGTQLQQGHSSSMDTAPVGTQLQWGHSSRALEVLWGAGGVCVLCQGHSSSRDTIPVGTQLQERSQFQWGHNFSRDTAPGTWQCWSWGQQGQLPALLFLSGTRSRAKGALSWFAPQQGGRRLFEGPLQRLNNMERPPSFLPHVRILWFTLKLERIFQMYPNCL